jgi:hypothetical protein
VKRPLTRHKALNTTPQHPKSKSRGVIRCSWLVEYEDGDQEKLQWRELSAVLKPLGSHAPAVPPPATQQLRVSRSPSGAKSRQRNPGSGADTNGGSGGGAHGTKRKRELLHPCAGTHRGI